MDCGARESEAEATLEEVHQSRTAGFLLSKDVLERCVMDIQRVTSQIGC